MKIRFVFILFFIISTLTTFGFSQINITKKDYLDTMIEREEKLWQEYKESLTKWTQSNSAGIEAEQPKAGRHMIRMPSFLYKITGEKKYAERTREYLLNQSNGDAYYTVFAVERIKSSGILSKADLDIVENKILESAERALNYWVEWGAMNHATQSLVNNLAAAMKHFPDHPDYEQWKQKLEINLSASWGMWSIEDSQIYIPAWNKPLMQCVELIGRDKEYYAMPQTKYYFDYLVQLMTPGGQIVEFGDGRYGRGYTWTWMISVLEKGASVYRDGKMKWAAHRLFEAHVKELGHDADGEVVEAYLWADDSIAEEIPTDLSRLVLEDYVGKKVVFRSGWDRNATYLFLNYMDDAPFGIDGKEYMINTINVESEKNHHGHADENAIGLLMKNGSILLYDSNYRETSSTGPDGQFRADVFHNKLVARNGLADPDWRLLPFLLDGGRYKFVNTKLMHFRRFKDVDISRTRLTYDKMGYQWDRLITYLKEKEWFVIFDIVKILRDGDLTLTNLFYTQFIEDFDPENPIWYDTYYRTIAAEPNMVPYYVGEINKQDTRLLMYFPEADSFRCGAEQQRNNVQTEWAVYNARADSFKAGELLVFTTLLIPHSAEKNPAEIVEELSDMKIFHQGNGYGLQFPLKDGFVQINAMIDLEAEYLKENVRPRYNFESGRAEYGDLVTDARYCYIKKTGKVLNYSFYNASRLVFDGQTIFQAEKMKHGQDDGSYMKYGVPKWMAWEDEVRLEK